MGIVRWMYTVGIVGRTYWSNKYALLDVWVLSKPIDNKPSHSAATWPLENETKNLSALPCKYVQVRCQNKVI